MSGVSAPLIHTLSLAMIITSFAAVEARNLRNASGFPAPAKTAVPCCNRDSQ